MVSGGASGVLRRIDQDQQLAALREIRLQLGDLRLEEIGLRAGDDDDRGVGRNVLLQQHERLGDEVVRLQLFGDAAVAGAVRSGDVALAVAR